MRDMFETKVHYKSYKAGKRWLYVAIGLTTLCAGLSVTTPANADTDSASATPATTQVAASSSAPVTPASADATGTAVVAPSTTTTDDATTGTQPASVPASQTTPTPQPTTTGQPAASAGSGHATGTHTPVTESTGLLDTTTDGTPQASAAAPAQTNQVTTPQKLTDQSQFTGPLAVLSSTQADPTVNGVSATVKVSATNHEGTMTSATSDRNKQLLAVNMQDTQLSVTYQVANSSKQDQGLWVYLILPKYSDATVSTAVANSVKAADITGNLPTGVNLSYITTNGTYTAYNGFDWSTLKELQLTGTLKAGDQYTTTLPLVMGKATDSEAYLSTIIFNPYANYGGSSADLQYVDPITPQSMSVPVATPIQSAATIDPTVTTPAPAISNTPQGVETTITGPVASTVRVTATNPTGSSTSLASNNNMGNYTTSVINANATDLTALLNVANTTDTIQAVNTYFTFQKYYSFSYPETIDVTLANSQTEAQLLANLPSSLKATYWVGSQHYSSYAALQAANLNWSDVAQIQLTGYLAGQSNYLVKAPLTVNSSDQYQVSGVSLLGAYNYAPNKYAGTVRFRIADVRGDVIGRYQAVQVNPDADDDAFVVAPDEVQAVMPSVASDEVTYWNYFADAGNTDDHFFNGGAVNVNYQVADFADKLKDLGYSTLLQADGQPVTSQLYTSREHDLQTKGDLVLTGFKGEKVAPSVYVVVRQVLATKDSALTVGSQWTDTDNFVSGLDNADQPLKADQVEVTVTDPTGIVQNGQVTAAGTFTVTYSYRVADDYYGTGQPYIIQRTATITVTDPNAGKTDVTGTPTGPTTTPVTPTQPETTGPTTPSETTVTEPDPETPALATPVTTAGAAATGTPVATSPQASATPLAVKRSGAAVKVSRTSAKLVRGGDGDHIVKTTSRGRGSVTQTADPTTMTKQAALPTTSLAAGQATATRLPQTNEQTTRGGLLAGLALILGTLGLVGTSRKQHAQDDSK